MKKIKIEQRSEEWFIYKAGKVSGTRLKSIMSNRKNKLLYEIVNETLDGIIEPTDFISDDMQRGIDLEPYAIAEYEELTGFSVEPVGVIQNENIAISMHSPDGVIKDKIILECKCPNPVNHLQSWKEGHDYKNQILNAFVVSPDVEEVHYFSYCPDRPEKPYFLIKYFRADFEKDIQEANKRLIEFQSKAVELLNEIKF